MLMGDLGVQMQTLLSFCSCTGKTVHHHLLLLLLLFPGHLFIPLPAVVIASREYEMMKKEALPLMPAVHSCGASDVGGKTHVR